MPTSRYPFPGMDPWLEHPGIWPDVHHRLITYVADELAERIAPRYSARHGERVVIETPGRLVEPDVLITERPGTAAPRAPTSGVVAAMPVVVKLPEREIRETFVEIRDRRSGNRVVTVIEVLSPANKRGGADGRRKYLRKQRELLRSDVSLVEIDLLRAGAPTVALPASILDDLGGPAYKVVVRRADRAAEADVYPIALRDRLPRLRVPLAAPDPDGEIELQPLLERAWRAGGYEHDIDYARPPQPALSDEDLAWARGLTAVRPPGA